MLNKTKFQKRRLVGFLSGASLAALSFSIASADTVECRVMSGLRRVRALGILAIFSLGAMVPFDMASARIVVLNFEGVAPHPYSSVQILDFYNGGTSSIGTSGENYGVHFDTNALAICLNTENVFCSNTSNGGVDRPTITYFTVAQTVV